MAGRWYWNSYFIDNDINREVDIVGPTYTGTVDWHIIPVSGLGSGVGGETDQLKKEVRISTTYLNRSLSSFLRQVMLHELGHVIGLGDKEGCSTTQTGMADPIPVNGPFTGSTMTCADLNAMKSRYPTNLSPIIIDLDGNGIDLSNAESGVLFDLAARGVKDLVAWPLSAADAFIVLDRNQSGAVETGEELFGNATPLASGDVAMNGYQALAEFDTNKDSVLSAQDTAFSTLRLWQDDNRNGISEPSELHLLEDVGVSLIDLTVKESRHRDRWGNEFQYRAKAVVNGRVTYSYDVFLVWRSGTEVP